MGGERRDLVQFILVGHRDPIKTAETIKNYDALPCGRVENPRFARTENAAQTDLRSRTRTHTPGQRQLKMRYMTVGPQLGSGQFRTVHKAIDADSGKLIAVKILVQPTRASRQKDWRQSLYYSLKREVETLSKISHVSSLRQPLIHMN